MDNIDQLLKDFYSKYGQEPLDDNKLGKIKSTYGNNYDQLLTDLYSKYNQPIDNNKIKLIKDTYKLNSSVADTSPLNAYIGTLESDNNYQAKNPNTSATGKYQHMWSIHKPTIAKLTGITKQEDYLNNPQAQEIVQEKFNADYLNNLPQLKELATRNGLNFNDQELLYLNHHSGLGNAKKYLNGKIVPDQAGLEKVLLRGREKFGIQPTQPQVVEPTPSISITQALTKDATELANKKTVEKQKSLGFFEKLSYNWDRKSIIGDMFDGNGYGVDTATPQEIEAAKLEVLQSGKYGEFNSAEELATVLDPKYKEKITKANIAASKQRQNLEDDFNTDAGLFDTNPFGENFGYVKDPKTGKKYADLMPTVWVGNGPSKLWEEPDKILKLTEHPLITKDPKKYNYREQKELNQHLRDIQSDLTKAEQIAKDANTGIYNNYMNYAGKRLKTIETNLTNKYGTLDPAKMSDEVKQKITSDPEYLTYAQLGENYNKEYSTLQQKSEQFKLAELNDSLAKEFTKKEDINYKKNYSKLGFVEKSASNIAEYLKDVGGALADAPGDLVDVAGVWTDAALGTDLGTSSVISKAYNADKIKTSNLEGSIFTSRTKLDGEDIYAVYNDDGEITRFTDGNYFTISDNPMDETFKDLLAKEKLSANSGKPTTGYNNDAFLHGVREPMVDIVPLIFGGGAIRSGLTKVASVLPKASRLANTLSKVANNDKFLTFAGSFAGFSGKIMDGAIKEGGLVDPLDIAASGTAKIALEAVIESFNPLGGSVFTDKLFSSLSKAQVKQLSKIITEEGVFKALPIIRNTFGKELLENGLGEAMEEIIATVAEPTVVNRLLNATLDTHYDESFSIKDVAESALVGLASGFAMGGVMEATPNAIRAIRNPSGVMQESLRAALQNKQTFDTLITQQKDNELKNAAEEDAPTITAKYDNVSKIMDSAAEYSAKAFKENPDTGHVPSSYMQTLYANTAFSKAYNENKEYDNEVQIEENNTRIDAADKTLKQLDIFIGNNLDIFTSIEDINSKAGIMSSEELSTNYTQIYDELKKVVATEGKSKNSDRQSIDNITAKIQKKLVELKNKTDNKVDDDTKVKVDEDLKAASAATKAEAEEVKVKEKAAKDAEKVAKDTAEALAGKTYAESKNPIVKQLQENLKARLSVLDLESPTVEDDINNISSEFGNLENKDAIIAEFKNKGEITKGAKKTEQLLTPIEFDSGGNLNPKSYIKRYGGDTNPGTETNKDLVQQDLDGILDVIMDEIEAAGEEVNTAVLDMHVQSGLYGLISQYPQQAKEYYDSLDNKTVPGIKVDTPPAVTPTPPVKPTEPVEEQDLQAKKADIERRRQEDLSKNKVEYSGYNLKVDAVEVAISTLSGGGFGVSVSFPNKNTSTGFLNSTALSQEFETRQEAIDYVNETIIPIAEQKINAKYDAEYVDAVKKGEMTKEQAMQALEKVGRKDSDAYAELKTLEQQPISNQSEIKAKKAAIEKRRQEDLKKGQLFLMNDGTYGGSRLVSLEEYSAIQIQENNLDSDVTKWDYNTLFSSLNKDGASL